MILTKASPGNRRGFFVTDKVLLVAPAPIEAVKLNMEPTNLKLAISNAFLLFFEWIIRDVSPQNMGLPSHKTRQPLI